VSVALTNLATPITTPSYCYAVFTGVLRDIRSGGTNELTIYHKSNIATVWAVQPTITLVTNFEFSSPEVTLNTVGPDSLTYTNTPTSNIVTGGPLTDIPLIESAGENQFVFTGISSLS